MRLAPTLTRGPRRAAATTQRQTPTRCETPASSITNRELHSSGRRSPPSQLTQPVEGLSLYITTWRGVCLFSQHGAPNRAARAAAPTACACACTGWHVSPQGSGPPVPSLRLPNSLRTRCWALSVGRLEAVEADRVGPVAVVASLRRAHGAGRPRGGRRLRRRPRRVANPC